MSVIVRKSNDKQLLICKGAVEEMLNVCSFAFDPGDDRALQIETDEIILFDEKLRNNIVSISRELNEDGLRVLIVAIKEFDVDHVVNYTTDDEKMTKLI